MPQIAAKCHRNLYFNPRSPHGERRLQCVSTSPRGQPISIHAPRTGSDQFYGFCLLSMEISIHAPRTGSDALPKSSIKNCGDFNPRSPHGERLVRRQPLRRVLRISIHAPRTGSDMRPPLATETRNRDFNPRSPHGERPRRRNGSVCRTRNFNPRSPHGERPRPGGNEGRKCEDFNPRSPHGERLRKVTILSIRIIDFAQKVYHKTVLLRISLAENAVILPEKPRNPVRTSLQKAGGLRFARAIRAAHPYSISSPSGA